MRLGVRRAESPPLADRQRGTKGMRVSPVRQGACPSPQLIKEIPKSHESQFRKCAICPLTLPEHSYYSPHRSNTNPTISRRNQTPREAPETQPRGLNAQAHPNGPHTGSAAQATGAISSLPSPPSFPRKACPREVGGESREVGRVPCPLPLTLSGDGWSIDFLLGIRPL